MDHYQECLEQTKRYADAFNKQDLETISSLLDDAVISSSQRREGIHVGKNSVVSRLKKLWCTAKARHKTLRAELAIIDLDDAPAHPCILVFVEKRAFAVVILEIGKGDKIYLLSAFTEKKMIKMVRLTDKRTSNE